MTTARLSVVIPVFNEVATIAKVIDRVRSAPLPIDREIIVVDDGSTDGTRDVLLDLARDGGAELRVLSHEVNRGKGAAIRTAVPHACGDFILVQDADLEYDPRDYSILLEPLLEEEADAVFGNRFHGGPHRVLYFWHYAGNRTLTLLLNVLTGLNLTDMEAGYKAIRVDVLKRIQLRSDRFGFEPEIAIKLAKLGCRIYEVPIRYYGRTYREGKKITWRDGVAALFHIVRFRFFDRSAVLPLETPRARAIRAGPADHSSQPRSGRPPAAP